MQTLLRILVQLAQEGVPNYVRVFNNITQCKDDIFVYEMTHE